MGIFDKKSKKEPSQDELIETGMTAQSYQDLQQSKRFNRIAIGCLSVTVLILAMMVSSKKTEIVVMPPDYYEPVIVNGNYANQSYAAGHAMMVANLMGNINERNIEFVTENVLRMLSPHLRAQLFQAFQNEVIIVKNRRARQTFYIEDVMFEPRNNIVFVWGNKRTSAIGTAEIEERFTYEFRIEPKNGMPKITHFDSYAGVPKPRDPNLNVGPQPYLTRELKLAKLMASDEVKYTPEEALVSEDKPKLSEAAGSAKAPTEGQN